MGLAHNKPLLKIVWSREADPSPEFAQYAEPGRTLLRKKDFKVVNGPRSAGVSGRARLGARLAPDVCTWPALLVMGAAFCAFWLLVFWLVTP